MVKKNYSGCGHRAFFGASALGGARGELAVEPSSQVDTDARSTKNNGQWYFGYKAYIGVDIESKLIRQATFTPANEHDSTQTKRSSAIMSGRCSVINPTETLVKKYQPASMAGTTGGQTAPWTTAVGLAERAQSQTHSRAGVRRASVRLVEDQSEIAGPACKEPRSQKAALYVHLYGLEPLESGFPRKISSARARSSFLNDLRPIKQAPFGLDMAMQEASVSEYRGLIWEAGVA